MRSHDDQRHSKRSNREKENNREWNEKKKNNRNTQKENKEYVEDMIETEIKLTLGGDIV